MIDAWIGVSSYGGGVHAPCWFFCVCLSFCDHRNFLFIVYDMYLYLKGHVNYVDHALLLLTYYMIEFFDNSYAL